MYIHKKSNHPPNIIKQIPLSIEKRLSNLWSNKQIFDEAAEYYEKALGKCGYMHKLKYIEPTQCEVIGRGSGRTRNITWFNPPFSKNVATNVGNYFLNLIKKHFPKNHKLSKIFNKNTLKLSYSCMPNIKSVINAHNRKVTTTEIRETLNPATVT